MQSLSQNVYLLTEAFNSLCKSFDDLLAVLDTYKRFVEEDKAKIQSYDEQISRLRAACSTLLANTTLPQAQRDTIIDYIEGDE